MVYLWKMGDDIGSKVSSRRFGLVELSMGVFVKRTSLDESTSCSCIPSHPFPLFVYLFGTVAFYFRVSGSLYQILMSAVERHALVTQAETKPLWASLVLNLSVKAFVWY